MTYYYTNPMYHGWLPLPVQQHKDDSMKIYDLSKKIAALSEAIDSLENMVKEQAEQKIARPQKDHQNKIWFIRRSRSDMGRNYELLWCDVIHYDKNKTILSFQGNEIPIENKQEKPSTFLLKKDAVSQIMKEMMEE